MANVLPLGRVTGVYPRSRCLFVVKGRLHIIFAYKLEPLLNRHLLTTFLAYEYFAIHHAVVSYPVLRTARSARVCRLSEIRNYLVSFGEFNVVSGTAFRADHALF